jgi:hypothetical protein
MKKLIVVFLLFTVSIVFAQEKKENPEKVKLQSEYTQVLKQANELKAQIYDAQEFLDNGKKQLEDFKKKMLELQQKYQAILDEEKKSAVKDEPKK